jgi:hypothetical protein
MGMRVVIGPKKVTNIFQVFCDLSTRQVPVAALFFGTFLVPHAD